jgi:surfactin synthase thioesterase subunit
MLNSFGAKGGLEALVTRDFSFSGLSMGVIVALEINYFKSSEGKDHYYSY